MKTLTCHKNIPVIAEVDILIIGAGPAGVCAAVSAAGKNVKTMIVEQHGFCGGMATAGLVGPILGIYHWDSGKRILGGIPYRLLEDMEANGGAELNNDGMLVPFDPEVMKISCEEMIRKAGTEIRYHTKAAGLEMSGSRITHLIAATTEGLGAISARMFIDCTGDGLVAARAGAPFVLGHPSDHSMMPMTTVFRIGGVNPKTIKNSENPKAGYVASEIREMLQSALTEGVIPAFGGPWIMRGSTIRNDEAFVNVVREWGDPTNWEALSRSEISGRADMAALFSYLRSRVPSLQNSYIIDSGAVIGIRDSRHFICSHRLTLKDCLSKKVNPDSIALGGHILDIHASDGTSGQSRNPLPPYEIPLGAAVFSNFPNLLIAGRTIDADYEIFSSLRVMGTCMAIGQGVGAAAKLSLERGIEPGLVPKQELAEILDSDGVIKRLDNTV